MTELRAQCLQCRDCGLCEKRHNVVFGVGNENAEIMFIGEGPGENEDLQGEPFVGKAGQLLDDMLEMIYLQRKDIYIANIVKCRPPGNRDPEPEEQKACSKWLSAQLELIRPKIIVCLGRIAATNFIREDYRISREHGQWVVKDGVLVTAIYHPSALLRNTSLRPDTFVDLKEIRSKIDDYCIGTYTLGPDGHQ